MCLFDKRKRKIQCNCVDIILRLLEIDEECELTYMNTDDDLGLFFCFYPTDIVFTHGVQMGRWQEKVCPACISETRKM